MPDFTPIPPNGRVLALDVGKKRIGLAISDPLGVSAQGLPTLHRTRVRDDIRELCQLARDREVALFLIGRPLHMSGDESRQSAYTAEFGDRLHKASGIAINYWDERLTTVEADRVLKEANATLEQRKAAIDKLSAVLLLESYLDAQHYRTEGA